MNMEDRVLLQAFSVAARIVSLTDDATYIRGRVRGYISVACDSREWPLRYAGNVALAESYMTAFGL